MPHDHHFDTPEAVARLEREAEAAAAIDAAAIERCRALLDEVRDVVDVGAGPGVSTARLAHAFPDATVVAVDGSAAMLERAAARGLKTVELDLDGDLSSLGTVDLVWSSMAVHHAADETAAVGRLAALVRPGGVLCLLEHDRPNDALLRAVGDAGLELRADESLAGEGFSRRLVLAQRPR